jgi:hypothetical protein
MEIETIKGLAMIAAVVFGYFFARYLIDRLRYYTWRKRMIRNGIDPDDEEFSHWPYVYDHRPEDYERRERTGEPRPPVKTKFGWNMIK